MMRKGLNRGRACAGRALRATALLAAALLAAGPAPAATSAVANAVDLGANAVLDWGSLGAEGTTLSAIVFVGWADSGTAVFGGSLQGAAPPLELRTEGSAWHGNFDPGTHLLYSGDGGSGPMSFAFMTPVRAVGTQIQRSALGSFLAQISAYDANGQPLQLHDFDYQVAGFSAVNQSAGAAAFIGLRSDSADIAKVLIQVLPAPNAASTAFAIGPLWLDDPAAAPVPEPHTAWLLLAGCALVGLRLRARD